MSPETEIHKHSINQLAWLIGGDILVLLLFTWIGERSHNLPGLDIRALQTVAAPFIIAWFGVAPWLGLFRAEVNQSWRKLVPRLVLAWIIAGPLGAFLRTLFLGRPVAEGINPTFVLVTMGVAGSLMLIWRLGYLWWTRRSLSHADG